MVTVIIVAVFVVIDAPLSVLGAAPSCQTTCVPLVGKFVPVRVRLNCAWPTAANAGLVVVVRTGPLLIVNVWV